jgi:hypothetical protein
MKSSLYIRIAIFSKYILTLYQFEPDKKSCQKKGSTLRDNKLVAGFGNLSVNNKYNSYKDFI